MNQFLEIRYSNGRIRNVPTQLHQNNRNAPPKRLYGTVNNPADILTQAGINGLKTKRVSPRLLNQVGPVRGSLSKQAEVVFFSFLFKCGRDTSYLYSGQYFNHLKNQISILLHGSTDMSIASAIRWLIKARVCKKKQQTESKSLAFEKVRELIDSHIARVVTRKFHPRKIEFSNRKNGSVPSRGRLFTASCGIWTKCPLGKRTPL